MEILKNLASRSNEKSNTKTVTIEGVNRTKK